MSPRIQEALFHATAVAGLAFTAVLGGGKGGPPGIGHSDKVLHFLAFLVLTVGSAPSVILLWVRVCRGAPTLSRKQLAGCFLYGTSVGAGLEIWQSFLPHRSAEWGDLLADALGALVGVTLLGLKRDVLRSWLKPQRSI